MNVNNFRPSLVSHCMGEEGEPESQFTLKIIFVHIFKQILI